MYKHQLSLLITSLDKNHLKNKVNGCYNWNVSSRFSWHPFVPFKPGSHTGRQAPPCDEGQYFLLSDKRCFCANHFGLESITMQNTECLYWEDLVFSIQWIYVNSSRLKTTSTIGLGRLSLRFFFSSGVFLPSQCALWPKKAILAPTAGSIQ